VRIALIGSNGMLARKVREQAPPGSALHGYDLPEFDITDRAQVLSELSRLRPEVIINCAAFTNVDACEEQEELATRVNGFGPGNLAEAAKAVGAVLVHISTDYVFDGRKTTPYREEDPVGPISAYGRSKLAGEQAILASDLEKFFIIRTSWLYGPGGKNFVETIIRLASEREELRVVADQFGTPTYTGDLAQAIYNLIELAGNASAFGIYHFSNLGECNWHEFATEIVAQMRGGGASFRIKKLEPICTEEYPLPAPRPPYSVFSKEKYLQATGVSIPDWQVSLKRYIQERSP